MAHAKLSTDTIFEDVAALQETSGLSDAEVASYVRQITRGGELPDLEAASTDALYRLAWVTDIRSVARDSAGIVMNALQWDLIESGGMPLAELRASVALSEPGHHSWITLDGPRSNLGVLWERSANALVEVARYSGDNLRLFVDVPLADFRAARDGITPELSDLSGSWDRASNRARLTLERGDLLADYLPPQNVGELQIRLDQMATWNLWPGARDALDAYIEGGGAIDSWLEHVLRALICINLGEDDSALEHVASLDLAEVGPDGHHYIAGLARDLASVDLERSITLLESVPSPGSDVLRDLATARWDFGSAEPALEAAERAIAIEPDDADLELLRGRILYAMEREEAREAYDRAIELEPDFADALSERGALNSEAEKWEAALADYEASLAVDPLHGRTRVGRARALVALDRGQEALADIEQLTLEEPYQDVLALYASLAEDAGRVNSAMTAHVKLLRHASSRNEAVERSLERLEGLGYQGPINFPWPLAPSQQIERFFLQGLDPEVAQTFHALRNRVFHANREGMTREALYAAEELIALLPGFFESWLTRGSVFLAAGYYEDALADAAEAMRLNGKAESTYLLAHECYRALGQFADATAAIEDAVARDPMSAQLHLALAVSREATEDYEGAIESLNEALRLSPGLHDARFNLGRLLDLTGDTEGAIREYLELLRESPNDAESRVNLATAFVGLGDFESARDQLLSAVDQRPDYLFAHQKLALVLAESGDVATSAVHFCISFALAEELILEANEFRQRFDEMVEETTALDVPYLRDRTESLQSIGLYDEAHAAAANLEMLGSDDPDYWLLRSELASMTTGADWVTDASHAARRAVELRADDPRIYYQLARTAEDTSVLISHSREWLQTCVADSEFETNLGVLVDLLAKAEGHEREAVELLELAERKTEEHDCDERVLERLLFRRAWLRDRAGDREESVVDYTRCIDMNPTEGTYWFNRACEYGIQGHTDLAVADLERAIEISESWRSRAVEEEYFDPIRGADVFETLFDEEA